MKKLVLALLAVAGFTVASLSARCGSCAKPCNKRQVEHVRNEGPDLDCQHLVPVKDCQEVQEIVTTDVIKTCPPHSTIVREREA